MIMAGRFCGRGRNMEGYDDAIKIPHKVSLLGQYEAGWFVHMLKRPAFGCNYHHGLGVKTGESVCMLCPKRQQL